MIDIRHVELKIGDTVAYIMTTGQSRTPWLGWGTIEDVQEEYDGFHILFIRSALSNRTIVRVITKVIKVCNT